MILFQRIDIIQTSILKLEDIKIYIKNINTFLIKMLI